MNYISRTLRIISIALLAVGPLNMVSASDASVDDDVRPVVSLSDAVVPESVGIYRVPIQLSQAASYPVTLAMTTRRGTAVNPEDFFGRGFSFSIPAGETESTFFFRVVDDTLAEPSENLSVVILRADGADIGNGVATIIIEDDDADALPQFLIDAGLPVTESNGTAFVTVTLIPPTQAETSVLIATRPGAGASALPGSDYYGIFRKLVFAPGEREKRVPITILDDQIVESRAEFFDVRLFRPSSNAGLIPFRSTTVAVILDDDAR